MRILSILLIVTTAFASTARSQSTDPLVAMLRQQVVLIRSDTGVSNVGFGTVVGAKENEILIVTAAHVVSSQGAVTNNVTISFYEPDPVDGSKLQRARLLQPIFADKDIAFLAAPASAARLTSLPLLSSHAVAVGDEVYYMGRPSEWFVPPRSGVVKNLNEGRGRIEIGGLELFNGSSGAPVFTHEGVIGMLRQRISEKDGYGVAFTAIRAYFDATFASQGWQWSIQTRAFRVRPATFTVFRRDSLEGVQLHLSSDSVDIPVSANVALSAPEGKYAIRAISLGGNQNASYVTCVPSDVVLNTRSPAIIDLKCHFNIAGRWKFSHGGWLEFRTDNVAGYIVSVLDDQLDEIGTGNANLQDEIYITINAQDRIRGSWSGRAKLSADSAMGRITSMKSILGDMPFVISRTQ